nr:GNAT family N-acetyltransferase [Candidatus Njordarchaeum guaymaensis]
MTNVDTRTYREGDEDQIARLLNECFGLFNSFGLTGEKWLRIFELDPGFRKDLAFVAEKDGKIISHVQVIVREMTVGSGAELQVAGIGNVSTLQEHRREGYSTRVMTHALEVAKEKGFPTSALFAGQQAPAHTMYQKLGFTDLYLPVMLFRGAKTPLRWNNEQATLTKSEPRVRIRESDEDDDTSLLQIYEKNCKRYNGLVIRDMKIWKSKFRNSFFYECPFYEEESKPNNILVAETEEGEIIGYAMSCLAKRDKLGHICEVLTIPGREKEAGRPLAERVASNLAEMKSLANMVYSSENTLIDELFRKGSSPAPGVMGAFMLKTLDMKRVIESSFHVAPQMKRHLPGKLSDHKGATTIQIAGGESTTTTFDGGALSVLRGEEKGGEKATFSDYGSFGKLLLGAKSFTELVSEEKVKMSTRGANKRELIRLFETVFPKKPILTCSGDLW